jgi:hypothetical protein
MLTGWSACRLSAEEVLWYNVLQAVFFEQVHRSMVELFCVRWSTFLTEPLVISSYAAMQRCCQQSDGAKALRKCMFQVSAFRVANMGRRNPGSAHLLDHTIVAFDVGYVVCCHG